MGKGIPGFALPGLVALLYLVASRRWSLLLEGRLRFFAGAVTVIVVALPWYVAMTVRHGAPFLRRLLIHDHINRLASGVHGDTGSIKYFVEQMGYGMFPWIGLAPAAVVAWLWLRPEGAQRSESGGVLSPVDAADESGRTQRYTLLLLGIWALAAFTLFSGMMTKFHHYIFPAVPPTAMLVGVFLDRAWGGQRAESRLRGWAVAALCLVSAVLFVVGAAALWGDVRGVIPEAAMETENWALLHPWDGRLARGLVLVGASVLLTAQWLLCVPAPTGGWGSVLNTQGLGLAVRARLSAVGLAVAALLVAAVAVFWAPALLPALFFFLLALLAVGRRGDSVMALWPMAIPLVAGVALVALVGRDLSWVTASRPDGYERLLHLFVYRYDRPWPDQFDYRAVLTGFTVASAVVVALLALRPLRGVAAQVLVGTSLVFCGWMIHVYLVDLSPHWGQRELVERYYETRAGASEPLAAWQMNWKGENFYTGNRVAAFQQLNNKKIKTWMEKRKGTRAFFILEHGRLGSFRSLMRGHTVNELSTKRENNKFVLVEATL